MAASFLSVGSACPLCLPPPRSLTEVRFFRPPPPFPMISGFYSESSTTSHYAFSQRHTLHLLPYSSKSSSFRTRSCLHEDAGNFDLSKSVDLTVMEDRVADDTPRLRWKQKHVMETETGSLGSFVAKLAIALGIAASVTAISVGLMQSNLGSSLGIQCIAENSSSISIAASQFGFTFKAFGYVFVLPERLPGWVYFWLLMAAGCGLFISEEALNIWVGISLARMVCITGGWKSFSESFSSNAPYILSTVLWIYWGVCISDLIPFYLGKLCRQTGVSDDVCKKLGIGKEKAVQITQTVQKYSKFTGFIERFSIGMRNPTAFLSGALGVSTGCFFAGVCCGGLITLPFQLGVGFLLKDRPLFAVATVATVVGIWTVFPYAVAAATSVFFLLQRKRAA